MNFDDALNIFVEEKDFEIYNNVINIVADNFDKPEEEQREKVFSYVNSLYP